MNYTGVKYTSREKEKLQESDYDASPLTVKFYVTNDAAKVPRELLTVTNSIQQAMRRDPHFGGMIVARKDCTS